MLAFRLTAIRTFQLCVVAQPEPAAGEVLVRIGAAGLCHSDLSIIDSPDALGKALPLTLGHEVAGWVDGLGRGVSPSWLNEAVAVYGVLGCRECYACLTGRSNECRHSPRSAIGLSRDGGMAEYVVVPETHLIRIGGLKVEQAAALTDAGLSAYHAIQVTGCHSRPKGTCVVIGVGGLGHLAVQILVGTTAHRVVAVDNRQSALQLARELGAHEQVLANDTAAKSLGQLMPTGADVVIDFVGSDSTLDLVRSVIGVRSDVAVVGLGGATLPVGHSSVPFETRVSLPFWGTKAELVEVLSMAREGHLRAHVERFSLQDAHKAIAKMRNGYLDGRAVLVPEAASVNAIGARPD